MNKTEDLINAMTQGSPKVSRLAPPPWRLLAWLLPTLVLVGGGAFMHGLRPDFESLGNQPMVLAEAVGLLLIAAGAAYGAFFLNIPGYIRPPWWVLLPWLATVGLVVWLGFLGTLHHEMVLDAGCHCLISIVALATVPSIIQFLMLRRGAPMRLGIDGSLGLLANLAIAAATQQLLCPINNPVHLVVWHLMPIVVGGVIGIVVGKRLLVWHHRSAASFHK